MLRRAAALACRVAIPGLPLFVATSTTARAASAQSSQAPLGMAGAFGPPPPVSCGLARVETPALARWGGRSVRSERQEGPLGQLHCVVSRRVPLAQGGDALQERLAAAVASATASGRPVVLVTSGGTKVPLEKNAVRFIDNFSTGTRGSRLVE